MGYGLRPEPALAWFGIIFDEAGQVRSLSSDLACVNMVGMRVFPVVREDGARAVLPNLTDHPDAGLFSQPYVAVRKVQVIANCELQLFSGGGRFGCADLRRAASAHLAAGHVENADSIPSGYQLYYCAAATQLGVIRMGSYGERIKLEVISHALNSYFGGYGVGMRRVKAVVRGSGQGQRSGVRDQRSVVRGRTSAPRRGQSASSASVFKHFDRLLSGIAGQAQCSVTPAVCDVQPCAAIQERCPISTEQELFYDLLGTLSNLTYLR